MSTDPKLLAHAAALGHGDLAKALARFIHQGLAGDVF